MNSFRLKFGGSPPRRFDKMRRASGFSLVEVMVGLLISLIGTFAMMQAFVAFEGQKRTTTSGSDAQQAGSFSLYEMERLLRTAGSGIVQGRSAVYNIWACTISARSAASVVLPLPAALPAPFAAVPTAIRLIPALIFDGGTDGAGKALPDVVQVMAGNPAVRTFGGPIGVITSATVFNATDSTANPNAFGIYPNEFLVASDGSGACRAGKVQAVVDIPASPINGQITLDGANSAMNGFSGPNQTYFFDLGTSPTMSLFGVDSTASTLDEFDLLQRNRTTANEVADGIVLLKAVYGVDDGAGVGAVNDGIVDEWVGPTGSWAAATLANGSAASATALGQIKAIRVAVVSRSQLAERASDLSNTTPITLFSDLANASLHYPVAVDTQYRYKVYDTTVPIRNANTTLLQ